ncbi:MAG: DUF4465 domain-containing protein [Bacteroidia bacterium]
MKTKLHTLLIAATVSITASTPLNAQGLATFDDLTLAPNTYWNGSDSSGSFTSGNTIFYNSYNGKYKSWTGFAYSNVTDILTAGYTNQYSAITGIGYNSSNDYAVCNGNPQLKFKIPQANVQGFYITNSTYAALSMKTGDTFAKKFGGATGNDPDFFKVSITGYKGSPAVKDSVEFYLADYRDADNTKDYILKTWAWVDLTSLGSVDSVKFRLSSSDVGSFGMNTPAYFCMDNFTTSIPTAIADHNSLNNLISIFPNPAVDIINITLPNTIEKTVLVKIMDLTGKLLYSKVIENTYQLNLPIADYKKGIYFLSIVDGITNYNQKFIKK